MTAWSVGMKLSFSVAPPSSIPASRMYLCMVFIATVPGTPDPMSWVAKHARKVWNLMDGMLLDWQNPRKIVA